jgi:hypothetical protein
MNIEKSLLKSENILKSINQQLCCVNTTLSSLDNRAYLHGLFTTTDADEMGELTITASSAGIYSALTSDGTSGAITFNLNSGGYVAFSSPLTLAVGDTLNVKRATTGATGWFELSGIYA